ncbi:MAG: hydrogenase expression/formation protein HypE [Verrucomicrobia bacterium]|nr:hydrogenase expression/formation protein HypE [Verrucomicrobiota bacterium]MDA1068001.1 hydrogenase expression/formation protein HypE [Verrucomicrobiota bacterium]
MNVEGKSPAFPTSCPFPFEDYPQVVLAHGGGGKLTQDLVEKIFLEAFGNPISRELLDGAILKNPGQTLVMSTDSHVVSPLFFPGGDIGSLSVYGTTNDISMCGARPLFLTAGFILEEGFSMNALWKIVQSMKQAAEQVGVQIVAGDTKVVEKGKGDGVYINTTGLGFRDSSLSIGPSLIEKDDVVLVSGDIGRHGITIMASREGLEFETELISDCGPLSAMVDTLLDSGIPVHCMRDLTRGGLATAILEISKQANIDVILEEDAIPVDPAVKGACEILGLDPLYVANEGCFAVFLPASYSEKALDILQSFPSGKNAKCIGRVVSSGHSNVSLKTGLGTHRYLTMLSGEQLPRIC